MIREVILLFIITITLAISGQGTEAELQGSKENFDETKISVRESDKEGSGRIAGGKEAPKHGYPSMVAIYLDGGLQCGGTIVHEEWIVSAAHCIIERNPSPRRYTFTAGDHNLKKNETTEQFATALEYHVHKRFIPATYRNDIVLFKVNPPLKLNEFVNKVVLPDPELDPKGLSTVVGWGRLNYTAPPSPTLQEVDIPIITNEKCATSYPESVFPESICAGYDKGGKDSCPGDSGGPLYLKEGEKQIIVGIVSSGIGCAEPGNPGIYTRVSKFTEWIEETTGEDLRPPEVKREKSCICLTFED